MSTPLSDPRKTKVVAVQDSTDTDVVHIYSNSDTWIASMDNTSFMTLFGEWAFVSIYHGDMGSSEVEMELFIETKTK
jgi:hypothetical protein